MPSYGVKTEDFNNGLYFQTANITLLLRVLSYFINLFSHLSDKLPSSVLGIKNTKGG